MRTQEIEIVDGAETPRTDDRHRGRSRQWAAVLAVLAIGVAVAVGAGHDGTARTEPPSRPPETQLIPFVTLAPPSDGVGSVDG